MVQNTLEGDKVLFEWRGSPHLWYYYGAAGVPIGLSLTSHKQDGYRKNLQGDITGVYSVETGDLLVSCRYDTDTGLYYLNSHTMIQRPEDSSMRTDMSAQGRECSVRTCLRIARIIP